MASVKEESNEDKSSNAILSELFGMLEQDSGSGGSDNESQPSDSGDSDSDSDLSSQNSTVSGPEQSTGSPEITQAVGEDDERTVKQESDEATGSGKGESSCHETGSNKSDSEKSVVEIKEVPAERKVKIEKKKKKKDKKKKHKHKKSSKKKSGGKDSAGNSERECDSDYEDTIHNDRAKHVKKKGKKKKHKKHKKKKRKHKSHAAESLTTTTKVVKKRDRSPDVTVLSVKKRARRRSGSPMEQSERGTREVKGASPAQCGPPLEQNRRRSHGVSRRHSQDSGHRDSDRHRSQDQSTDTLLSPKRVRRRSSRRGRSSPGQSPHKDRLASPGMDRRINADTSDADLPSTMEKQRESRGSRRKNGKEKDTRVVVCGEGDRIIIQAKLCKVSAAVSERTYSAATKSESVTLEQHTNDTPQMSPFATSQKSATEQPSSSEGQMVSVPAAEGPWKAVVPVAPAAEAAVPLSTADIPIPPTPHCDPGKPVDEGGEKTATEDSGNENSATAPSQHESAASGDAAQATVKGPKKTGGIVIKNLKNSAFEETMRQAEEEAKKREEERASRLEDGEISDSESEEDTTVKTVLPDGVESVSDEDPDDMGEVDDSDSAGDHRKKSRRKSKKSDDRGKHKKDREDRKSRRRNSREDRHKHRASSRRSSRDRSASQGNRDGDRDRGRDRDKDRVRDRHHSRSTHASHYYGSRDFYYPRSRSHSRDRSRSRDGRRDADLRERIDKRRLLEVAQRKVQLAAEAAENLPHGSAAAVAAGRNVHELTEMCRRLQEGVGDPKKASDKDPAFHHPFAIKERVQQIFMKIRNSQQLPVKSHAERQLEVAKFPVSSGEVHRTKELEWVPVKKETKGDKKKTSACTTTGTGAAAVAETGETAANSAGSAEPAPTAERQNDAPERQETAATSDQLQPTKSAAAVDVDQIVSSRLTMMRQEQKPDSDQVWPNQDWAAPGAMHPGTFTGSTGARVLSAEELSSGQQAWARKNQMLETAPVKGGFGEALLKRMGWQPGQGLGKNRDGQLTPLLLEVKMDKKGLVSEEERPANRRQPAVTMHNVKDLSGKHPISAVMEVCTKRRWGSPNFQLCLDQGPAHSKTFLYKVTVNNVTYQPSVASHNKKLAKASAAAACLQALGLLPREA